jgi:hypothetical protein
VQRDHHDLIVIDLVSIRGRHSGRRAVVLGGGPTLLSDLRLVRPRLQATGLFIGVNQHALLLPLDYVVFQDREIAPILQGHGIPLVTHHKDVADIWSGIIPDLGFSGGAAVWFADYIGCDEIILCGVDDYTQSRRYWHSPPGYRGLELGVTATHAWKKVRDYMTRPEIVSVASGPAQQWFKPYAN